MSERAIVSPDRVVIEPYSPGLTIDFREPPAMSDAEAMRLGFASGERLDALPDADLRREAGRLLVALGVTEVEEDFADSLAAFTRQEDFAVQLETALRRLGVDSPPARPIERLLLLLRETGSLSRPPHHPVRLRCHRPGSAVTLEPDSTHYGYALSDGVELRLPRRAVPLTANSYFSLAGEGGISGDGRCVVITRFGYRGMTLVGGELEPWGRLNYIDGCTDTLLLSPPRRGDPCLNALYFPPRTRQTRHLHPSIRCGVVVDGEGVCDSVSGSLPLRAGDIFFLPPETMHGFNTEQGEDGRAALTVLAFHPDSDFGPTDEDHPMINRTYYRFLHRLGPLARARTAG
ncbi:MAG TPA: AraC family ligand binding domain-containing protein [Allosphingosinicella sp.]|nr:AraC family ligand binding domain-containing protein [Allosphingosinicella sp.]